MLPPFVCVMLHLHTFIIQGQGPLISSSASAPTGFFVFTLPRDPSVPGSETPLDTVNLKLYIVKKTTRHCSI